MGSTITVPMTNIAVVVDVIPVIERLVSKVWQPSAC